MPFRTSVQRNFFAYKSILIILRTYAYHVRPHLGHLMPLSHNKLFVNVIQMSVLSVYTGKHKPSVC